MGRLFEITRITVYVVATFYKMYELQPVGKYNICVCSSILVLLQGSEKIEKHIMNKLGIKYGETTQMASLP